MLQNTRSKWVWLLVGVFGVLVLGVSCAPWQVTAEDETKPSVVEKKDGAITELISAGQDPKSALRYKVAKGDKQYVTLTADIERQVSFEGFPFPQRQRLEQKITLLVTVTNVAASGDISFDVSIAKAELIPKKDGIPRTVPQMERMDESLVGLSANFVVSSRGEPKYHSTNWNEGLDPSMKQ